MSYKAVESLPLKVVQHAVINRVLCEEGMVLCQEAKHHVSLLLVKGLELKGDCCQVLMARVDCLVLYLPLVAVVACLYHQMVRDPLYM